IAQGEVQPDVYYIQQETGVVFEQQLGNKILAYGVDDPASGTFSQAMPKSVLTPDHTCLSTYLIESAQQKQYALQEEYLQQIISLGTQLVSELGKTFTMKWTIAGQATSGKLYITQVSSPQSVIPHGQLIRGLGAAGGRVVA
ncbi:MAG: putative PEP-binding protein, partial [Nostoc sp.]